MSDLKTRLIPRNFRKKRKRSSKDEEFDDGVFCLRKSIKNSDWGKILSKIETDEVRLADISKHCTMMPPKYYQSILDRMIRPKSGNDDFESEDFTIEFNFDFFGQSRNSEIIQYSAPETVLYSVFFKRSQFLCIVWHFNPKLVQIRLNGSKIKISDILTRSFSLLSPEL